MLQYKFENSIYEGESSINQLFFTTTSIYEGEASINQCCNANLKIQFMKENHRFSRSLAVLLCSIQSTPSSGNRSPSFGEGEASIKEKRRSLSRFVKEKHR